MMSGSRPSIFSDDDAGIGIDLSGFAPKTAAAKQLVPPETLEQVSEENGFPSRAPKVRAARPQPSKRPVLAKSGRTVLLNARITQRAHDRFHKIVEAERQRYETGELMHCATLGEIVERALAALEREIGQDGRVK
ncbi:MAG: hypothetical protein WB902_10935 [Acetobacteraceae bacterium]|jgi:hypothetical protein